MKNLRIAVSGIEEARRSVPSGTFTHVISLIGPEFNLALDAALSKHLIVHMDDIEGDVAIRSNEILPNIKHIHNILAFTANLSQDDNLLVHCRGGISRSSAAAIGIHCQHGVPPTIALNRVLEIRSVAWPNRLIIKHFDDALGLSGRLISVIDKWIEDQVEEGKRKLFIPR